MLMLDPLSVQDAILRPCLVPVLNYLPSLDVPGLTAIAMPLPCYFSWDSARESISAAAPSLLAKYSMYGLLQ